jgi:hypothetical protein
MPGGRGTWNPTYGWISRKRQVELVEFARLCAENFSLDQEVRLGRVQDLYRTWRPAITTKNPFRHATRLVRPKVFDRNVWYANFFLGSLGSRPKTHTYAARSMLREWHVFEVVSHRERLMRPEGARTTVVRFVGPHPDLWLPEPPLGTLPERDYR